MRPLLALLLVVTACVEPAEDPVGAITPLAVELVADNCVPARPSGDGGLQFFAVLRDGGFAFTVSQQLQFGPLRDGGVLESVQRQNFPTEASSTVAVGPGPGCQGTLTRWLAVDGGLELAQLWPSAESCPEGPAWLPQRACSTTRRYRFGEGEACPSSCVRISEAPEVRCDCAAR